MEQHKKIITVREKEIGGNQPLICTPLIGAYFDQVMDEVENICQKQPDMIEWRADFFKGLDDTHQVIHTVSKIREAVGETPLIFTIRSEKEGGQPISLAEKEKVQLFADVCKSGQVDIIDYELVNNVEDIQYLRQVSREFGVHMIMSYHNFESTPGASAIIEKLLRAEFYGADVAKVAVMPKSQEDVLVLLKATEDAYKLLKIPMVTMSMGGLGAITRMFSWVFGSNITFAIGHQGSAPGQIPIEDLKSVIQITQRSLGNGHN
ncbi:type I 3-dehydroquinate dehydratase [Microaerobacter geothermalis]|uniref:type I 3-dehydroquinate dehydratase n=1 Tax=Microaerobacter geothermalis TaxID=674972 RepID=UPI001F191FEC|nr:type I 3-dehydroquinate dehydratase [Microaerobacter geothermalis]MCF6094904.1 type I 3-dehydroquinate dehydratase [Microaerobacter geothermalis]